MATHWQSLSICYRSQWLPGKGRPVRSPQRRGLGETRTKPAAVYAQRQNDASDNERAEVTKGKGVGG